MVDGRRKGGRDRGHRRKKEKKVYPEFTGRVQMTREGYAFVIVEGEEDDIFVKASRTRGALNGDTVRVAVLKEKTDRQRKEGEVLEILERSRKPFVGILHVVGDQAWVLMESRVMPYDIVIPVVSQDPDRFRRKKGRSQSSVDDAQKPEYMLGSLKRTGYDQFSVNYLYETVEGRRQEMTVRSGMKVAAIVDKWDKKDPNPTGHLVDVLGEPGENDTEMHAILAEYSLPYRFEPEVENAADDISDVITGREGKKGFPRCAHLHHRPCRCEGLRRRAFFQEAGQREL